MRKHRVTLADLALGPLVQPIEALLLTEDMLRNWFVLPSPNTRIPVSIGLLGETSACNFVAACGKQMPL